MAEVEDRIVVKQRHTKFLQPALAAEHIAANINDGGKKYDGIELPIKAVDCHLVAKYLKFTIGGTEEGWSATLNVEPELLAVHALEDARIGHPGVGRERPS